MKTFIFILQLILFVQIHSSLEQKLDKELIEVEAAKCKKISNDDKYQCR